MLMLALEKMLNNQKLFPVPSNTISILCSVIRPIYMDKSLIMRDLFEEIRNKLYTSVLKMEALRPPPSSWTFL